MQDLGNLTAFFPKVNLPFLRLNYPETARIFDP